MSTTKESCRVWSRVELKRKDGSILKLRFQDPPMSAMDSVIDFILENFPKDETFQKATGAFSNPEAKAHFRTMLEFVKSSPVVICCHDNDSEDIGEIIGASVADIVQGDSSIFDEKELPTTESKEFRVAADMLLECERLAEPVMKEFKFHLAGRMMTVHPDYRGLGIASEFMKIRRLLMIDQNIPVTCSWMTAFGSQKAAKKDNWETLFEVNSKELGLKYGVVFEDAPPTFKLMLARNPKFSEQ